MTLPYDEPEIGPDDIIIRRIDPNQHVIADKNTGRARISSKAFKPSSGENGGMSVDIEKLIRDDGLDPQEFVVTPKFRGAVSFNAAQIREINLQIGYDPIVDMKGVPDNPYHGEVWGAPPKPNKFSRAQINALQQAATWYVELDEVDVS